MSKYVKAFVVVGGVLMVVFVPAGLVYADAGTITSLVDSSGAMTSVTGTATSGLVLRGGVILASVVISWIRAGRMTR
jgi:hypothetical protein